MISFYIQLNIFYVGTRFVHTSEGRFLVTRLVPCPRCLVDAETVISNTSDGNTPKSNELNENILDIHSQFHDVI